ncbi:hypothetical protein [Bradyrhizobium commune]|uniref:Uncharacterized protein n=1 Tax=Bradyrhizobium commune TaxID=83627 RepID=A0A7S9D4F0_9BRAD|nr:hypothetical protein [Bradyrhizobium commune]QPF90229.1 hypothetical protein IC761_27540 [Bradyrhizobium commune]
MLIVGATGSAEACFGPAVPKDLAVSHRSIKCQKKTIWKAARTWAANMADKRACRGLRVDQGPSKELYATTEAKSNQRTKIVLNNPAERIAAAILPEIRDCERPQAFAEETSSCGRHRDVPRDLHGTISC